MAQVQMPDGTIVEMPDQLDPALGARLRAFQAAQSPPGLADREIPGIRVTPAQIGHTAAGEIEGAGQALGNIPHAFLTGVADLAKRLTGASGQPTDPRIQRVLDAIHVETTPDTAAIGDALSPITNKVNEFGHKLDNAVEGVSPTALDVVRQINGVTGDLASIAPMAGAARGAAGLVDAAATRRATALPEPAPTPEGAGFRTQTAHPMAAAVADESGQQALVGHNQTIGNTIAANEAGHQPGVPLSYPTLATAREAPSAVYNRVANALPTGVLDQQAQVDLAKAGQPGGTLKPSVKAQADIDAFRDQLMDATTGEEHVENLRALRQKGYKNIASDAPEHQELGSAQLDMARAVEGHIARNLPPNADVSIDQFQQAREAMAKNHAVEGALRGSNVDLGVIARLQRADPQLLTGGLKTIADFANEHPSVTKLASRSYDQPSITKDILGNGSKPESLIDPGRIAGMVGGRALARRVLTGSESGALASANRMFPPRSPTAFSPLQPKPAAPGTIDFTPSAPSGLSLAPEGAPSAAPSPGGISLADLLSHGVERPPAPGLSLGDAIAPPQGIPFRPNLEHAAGGLTMAPEDSWFHQQPPALGDLLGTHADVMSQGVPEGIMSRTQRPIRGTVQTMDFPSGVEHPTIANNASGESAASQEAINRGTRNLVEINPDGEAEPVLRDVTQADRNPGKGNIIVDADSGDIVKRGALSETRATGLRNRWASLNRKPARALGDELGGG